MVLYCAVHAYNRPKYHRFSKPPLRSMERWLHKLKNNIEIYTKAGFEVVLCGDFNAVFPVAGARDNTDNKKFGKILYRDLKRCGLRASTGMSLSVTLWT